MSFIIGKACDGVCDTACVTVCPVDCIHGPIDIEGMGKEVQSMSKEELVGKQLYIDPTNCIDCGACLPECPVEAIYRSEKDAIKNGEFESVKKNYNFFSLNFEN